MKWSYALPPLLAVLATLPSAAVLAGVFAAVSVQAQALYVPPEGDFSVAFPAPPTAQAQPGKRMNDVSRRRYVVQTAGRAYVLLVEQYPQGMLPPSANAAVYDRLLRSHADDSNTELISTRPARLAGLPSLEGTFKDTDGDVEVIRVLMLNDRIYRLTCARAPGLDDAGEDGAFFGSFKLAP